MLLKIKNGASPMLRLIAEPVAEVTSDIRTLAADMRKTMFRARGIGLAAPQVGRSIRMIVVCETPTKALVLINPEYTPVGELTTAMPGGEGCLSFPGQFVHIKRLTTIDVKAIDENGLPVAFRATGKLAICIQHEVDHLDGKLIVDHVQKRKLNG
jgi:peptide deformylase